MKIRRILHFWRPKERDEEVLLADMSIRTGVFRIPSLILEISGSGQDRRKFIRIDQDTGVSGQVRTGEIFIRKAQD